MAWRLHDIIRFNIVNLTLNDLKNSPNIEQLDILLDTNGYVEWFTFSPQYHEVFEAFNQIVRTQSKQITTVNQVKKFVEHCFNNAYDKANKEFDIDDMYACVCETNIPEDTIIVIEFED